MIAPRLRHWLLRVGIGVAALLVVAALALAWLLYSTSGLRFALERGVAATHGQFGYANATGTLAGEASIDGLRYRNADGTTLAIAHATLDLKPWALLARRLHVRKARIDGITLDLWPAKSPTPAHGNPLQPPLTIALDDILLTHIAISASGKPAFAADSLALAARWSKRDLAINRLALRAPAGSVDLAGELATRGKPRGHARASIDWSAHGARYTGTLDATSDGATARLAASLATPLRARAEASVALDPQHAWTITLKAPSFAAHALPGLPAALKTLAIDLRGSGDGRDGKILGTLAANDHVVTLDPAQFRYDGTAITLAPLRLTSPSMPGVASAQGTIRLAASPVQATLGLTWRDVQLPADLVGQPLASHGELHFDGGADRYAVKGKLSLGPPGHPADLAIALDGTPQAIDLKELRLLQVDGGFTAHGRIQLQPELGWNLDADAKRFDPGALFAGWSGALDFTLATQGRMAPRGPEASLKLADVAGRLRGHSLAGSKADLAITPDNLLAGTFDLVAGGSRIRASGKPGAQTDARIAIDLASLGDWLPSATGSLHGAFDVRGVWPKLALSGLLAGSKLAYDGRSIDSLRLTAKLPELAQPRGSLELALTDVKAGDFAFSNIRLVGSGSASAQQVTLSANGTPLGASLAVQGSWNAVRHAWTGSIRDLEISPRGMPAWRQQQATALAWNAGAASLGRLCLSAGTPQLCVGGNRNAQGAIAANFDVQHLPLQLLTSLAGGDDPLLASGEVSGNGKLTLAANGTFGGSASLATSAGQLTLASSANQPLLAWTRISADATETGGNQHLALSGILADGGHLNGAINLRGGGALDGTIVADLRSLAFISALSPEVANVKGSLAGALQLGGTLAAPRFTGRIQTRDFSAELPRAGLKLHDGAFAVTGDPQGRLAISGQIGSGQGTLRVEGSSGLAADAPLSLAIKGDNVLVADIPAAHVVASPDLSLARVHGVYALTGSLAIPDARIEAEKLPGQGPTTASPDVVIVDAPPAEKVAPLALDADIAVKLGDNVKLRGYGLDGNVDGQLAVRVTPGKPATGRGQISVAGKYQAYGQDLVIERGRLLFAATPLDNPGLDIRAVRKIPSQSITVGLAVRGTAAKPVLTVFSDPAMEQAEALSYLVTGRSMETLKGGDGDTLNTAAQALGGLAGDRVAKAIGARLGIEAGVSSSAALGGTAFTAGKYLSPRLFLSYGVGLFTPGQVITLRYTLNRFLQFEAENATTGNRASLNYRIEK